MKTSICESKLHQKIFAILTVLAFAFALNLNPAPAHAVETYNLYVSGVQVTSDNAADILGDGTVSYNSDTKTLTLNGAALEAKPISGTAVKSALHIAEADVTIELVGSNSAIATDPNVKAIYGQNCTSLVIKGINGGTLTAQSSGGEAFQADNTNVTVDGCSITATSDTWGGFLVWGGTLTIQNNASVFATGGQDPSETFGESTLFGENGITITDSYVEAITSADEANVISSFGALNISNSTVKATGTSDYAFPALYAAGDITVSQSDVTAKSASHGGIFGENNMSVTGSTVEASGTLGEGIAVVGNLEIVNSTLTASSSPDYPLIPAIATEHLSITDSDVTTHGVLQLCDYFDDDTSNASFSVAPASGKALELKVDSTDRNGSSAIHFDGGNGSPYDSTTTFTTDDIEKLASYLYVHIGNHTHVGGVATCSAPAICDNCGKTYGSTDPNNHSWGGPVWNWASDGSSCTATFTCANSSSHTQTLNASISSVVKASASCTEKGITSYTATIEFNGTSYTTTREVADIPLLAHTYENGICSVCGAIEPTAQSADDALPETGDHTFVAIGALLVLALCAVAAGAYSLRKVRRH